MRYLRTNTAVIVTVGPFYDKTDGVTIENALTITNERITLTADTDAGAAPTLILDNITGATTATANDLNYITAQDAGLMQLELAAADVNRLGRMFLSITDAANHVPVFHEFMVLTANSYDAMFDGTGIGIRADVRGWLGTAPVTPDTAGHPKVTVKSGAGTGEISLSVGEVTISASARAAIASAVLDENVTLHTAANSLGAVLQPAHSGACQAGGTGTTVVLASGASAVDSYYNGDQIFGWVTADRTNFFADYILTYVGATRTATVTGIPVSPGATYTYVVLPGGTIPGASAPTAADNAAAVWDKAMSAHLSVGSFGQMLNFLKIRSATAQAGTSASITFDASASATDDLYNFNHVTILSGTGAGQTRQIIDYVGATKIATVNLVWIVIPSSDSVFAILPGGLDAATVAAVAAGVWAATRAGNATAGSFGEYGFTDVLRLSGDATAADNAEAFFDGTGYAGTNNVIPTVTTVTNTINADMVKISTDSVAADNLEALLDGTGGVTLVASAFTLTTAIKADAFSISGDSVAADNAESFFDGVGYAGTNNTIPTVTNVGTVTGSVVGSVASVTGAVGSVTVVSDKTGYRLSATGVDDILDDPITEPAGVFAWASATPRNILSWLGARSSNRETQTATTLTTRNRANTVTLGTSTVSDDATTAVKGSFA